MIKQLEQKNKVYESILQTHQNNLKRYLDLAPRLGPQELGLKKINSHRNPIQDKRFSLIHPNKGT